MIGETATTAAVCIIAAIFATLLKQYNREHAIFCVIAACITILIAMCAYLSPVIDSVGRLFAQTGLPDAYLEILWKALGISYLTSIAGDLCRDCGDSALAQMAELWGRLSLVLLALPLLQALLETVTEVLS